MNTKKHAIIALAIGIAASSLLTAPTVAGALELWATGPNSRFDGVTGAYVGPLRIGGPGLSERGMAIGPDGALYVCGETQGIQGAVQRYDANTHQYIDTFVESHAGGLTGPSGLAFGADGNLYVTSSTQDSIYRFDGQSGEFMDIFASEGMDTPRSVLFGPDGNLYVASQGGDCVVRYDALTGDLIDIFATDANLRGPGDLVFGPDGDLYVSSPITPGPPWTGSIIRFDGTTGDSLGFFVEPGDDGPFYPIGLTFGPDGNLYVGDNGGEILRYDGQTGAFLDVFAETWGVNVYDLLFVPEPTSLALLLVGAGAVLRRRR